MKTRFYSVDVDRPPSKLLKMMFEYNRWQALLDNATEKEIDLVVIKELCDPKNRRALFDLIHHTFSLKSTYLNHS